MLANPKILERRQGGARAPAFYVYDVFKTPSTSFFAQLTRSYAESAGIGHLLREGSEWLDFYDAFRINVGADDVLLTVCRGPVNELKWLSEPIGFLHLDLPKDSSQARSIARQMFQDLIPGAYLLYQDFVYQWSAELIGTIGFLIRQKMITPKRITSSTLTCSVRRKLFSSDIADLSNEMQVPTQVLSNFDFAI